MEENWKIKDAVKRHEMRKNLKLTKFIVIFCLASVETSVALYTLIRLLTINFEENSSDKLLFLSSKFFYDTNNSPAYEVTWMCQLMATILAGIVFMNYDAFFIITVLHLSSQFSVLKMDIKDLVVKSNKENMFTEALKAVVQRHLQLIR